jgi:dihydroorotase
VTKENIMYKCGWSPFEGIEFSNSIDSTYVNGRKVYDRGNIIEAGNGSRLIFNR